MFKAYFELEPIGTFNTFEDAFRALFPKITEAVADGVSVDLIADTTFMTYEERLLVDDEYFTAWAYICKQAKLEGLLDEKGNLVPRKEENNNITTSPRDQMGCNAHAA